jgi:hypothetical protein
MDVVRDLFRLAGAGMANLSNRRSTDVGLIYEPVGFYKRGCQVKILFLFREEGMFFRHPAPIRSCTNPGRGAVGRTDFAGGMQSHELMRSSRGLIAPSSSVLAIANHGSI